MRGKLFHAEEKRKKMLRYHCHKWLSDYLVIVGQTQMLATRTQLKVAASKAKNERRCHHRHHQRRAFLSFLQNYVSPEEMFKIMDMWTWDPAISPVFVQMWLKMCLSPVCGTEFRNQNCTCIWNSNANAKLHLHFKVACYLLVEVLAWRLFSPS